jgi:hypothetical protein
VFLWFLLSPCLLSSSVLWLCNTHIVHNKAVLLTHCEAASAAHASARPMLQGWLTSLVYSAGMYFQATPVSDGPSPFQPTDMHPPTRTPRIHGGEKMDTKHQRKRLGNTRGVTMHASVSYLACVLEKLSTCRTLETLPRKQPT